MIKVKVYWRNPDLKSSLIVIGSATADQLDRALSRPWDSITITDTRGYKWWLQRDQVRTMIFGEGVS